MPFARVIKFGMGLLEGALMKGWVLEGLVSIEKMPLSYARGLENPAPFGYPLSAAADVALCVRQLDSDRDGILEGRGV